MVLTDRDFGRAYLVDGWAARFLEAMFHHSYEVLFVGYSHSDVVMRYLGRGLRGSARRYGFIEASRSNRWRPYSIAPIEYPVFDDDHSALDRALLEWVRQGNMGLLDHERRISDLLQRPGVVDPPTDSYLAKALTDPTLTGFFCDHARGLNWLPWLEGQAAMQNLFDPTFQGGEVEGRLAKWFADEIAVNFPSEGVSLLHRKGGRWSPVLSAAIAQAMLGHRRPPSAVVRRWVILLLDSDSAWNDYVLNFLLAECVWPDDRDLALRLFDRLTGPRLALRRGFGSWMATEPSEYADVAVEPALIGEEHSLREAWVKQFKPRLAECAIELSVIVTRNLLASWQQQSLFGPDDESYDMLSAHRAAIEIDEQDSYPDDVDVLIDAARDVLQELLTWDDGSGAGLLQLWSRVPGALFHRLVIHGWTQRQDKSSDDKLQWLLANERLVEGGARHEAFRLVAMTLASASQPVRIEVLEMALRPPEVDYEAEPEHLRYITYNLLYWLTLSDPDFEEARQHFERVQSENPNFRPREHPDFGSWSSGGSGSWRRAPVTLEELIALDFPEKRDWLLSYEGMQEPSFLGPSRSGLLQLVSQAAVADFAWSQRLVQQLEEASAFDNDLWSAIFEGWETRSLSSDEWADVLTIIDHLPRPEMWLRNISRLLKEGVSEQGGLSEALLPRAESVARTLWNVGTEAEANDDWTDESNAGDRWLNRA